MPRDRAFEATWMENLTEEASHLYGTDAERFLNQVKARLDRGDTVFGDEFLERDNLTEGLEEGADYLAYLMFDAESNRGTEDYEDAPELFRAALMLTAVDKIVREVRNRRRR